MVKLLFQVKLFLLKEQLFVFGRYYRNIRYACADLALLLSSLFFNPYRACRKFLQKRGEREVYAYGETPLRVFEELARAAGLGPGDTYIELGSGRGKSCLWAASHLGCRAVGIEWVPPLVRLSSLVAYLTGIDARFKKGSFFELDLSEANVVYFYAIHLSDEDLERLTPVFETMPEGARFIAIGEPIQNKKFSIRNKLIINFPWGETEAYIQISI